MGKSNLENDTGSAADTNVADTQVSIQPASEKESSTKSKKESPTPKKTEIGGRKKGLEPTRYGDWEKNGRCIDF